MKRKTFQKHICFFLALFMIFSLTACNGNNEVPDQQTQETEAATRPRVSKSFVPTEDYVIVRSDLYAADPNISDACFYLKKALEKAYGITVKIETDSVKASASRREFLVGVTNRPESQDAYTVLELDEYTYNVASEKAIVMCGGTPAMTYEAVKKFCLDLLTYDGKSVETKNTPLKTLKKFSQNDVKYEYSTVTINGILLEDYALVVSSSSDIAGAIELSQRIGQYTGQILPIRHVSEMTGEEESIIRIGAAYRDGKGSNKLNGYMINNYVDEKGTVICIDAASTDMYKNALDDFFSKTEKNVDGSTVAFTVNEETVYSVTTTDRYGGNKTAEYVHWDLTLETTQELSDGLTYIEQTFYDDAGLPYRVYTLIVDTEKYTFDMGTANDGFDYTVTKADKQTTQQHMQAAVKNGKNVVAGINTDFFDIEDGYLLDDNHPFGMTIKEGVVISTGSLDCRPLLGVTGNNRAFFGVDENNKAIIAMESEYSENMKLQTAVGGAYILCEEGKTNFFSYQHDMIHGGINPRAIAGFREDGTVILMVIDGRQPAHSNGNSLLQSSLLMHRFAASDAILFDCGGSANLVLRDPARDSYTTANKPSDGKLRPIYNSLLVIAKD